MLPVILAINGQNKNTKPKERNNLPRINALKRTYQETAFQVLGEAVFRYPLRPMTKKMLELLEIDLKTLTNCNPSEHSLAEYSK